jgi:hypothetical protein
MAKKVVDPDAIPPNKKMLIGAIVLVAIGLAWSVYNFNPGGALRAETEAEKKERKEAEQAEKDKLKHAKKGGGH